MPEALARDHIITWSNPGDVVIDPFMGSGTTAAMAIDQGRDYIGFEIDDEYYQLCQSRLKTLGARLTSFLEDTEENDTEVVSSAC